MPESPDFEQIARRTVGDNFGTSPNYMAVAVAEQLRLVWNARGAADIAKLAEVMDDYNDYPASLGRTLRSLDR